jgi:hypothetical protein
MERLKRAGLGARLDSGSVRMEPLTIPGARIQIGRSSLEVFLYADSASRRLDEQRLDPRQFIEAAAQPTLRGEATLIRNGNLLAILHSRSEQQRERVSDALTAGAPQPQTARPLTGGVSR